MEQGKKYWEGFMKKAKRIWLLMVVAMLTGCSNATTFDFDEFVERYPDEYTEATDPEESETDDIGVGEANEVLYKTELVVNANEDERIYQYCVFGDTLSYASKNGDKTDIYWVSISEETEEQVWEVDGEIETLICSDRCLAWTKYNEKFDLSEVYIYENGRTIRCSKLEKIGLRWDGIVLVEDYLIVYNWSYGGGVIAYDINNGYISDILSYEDFVPNSRLVVSFEGVFGVVTDLNDLLNVQVFNINGGKLYECAIEAHMDSILVSKELLLWRNCEDDRLFIEFYETREFYSIGNLEEVCVSGKWLFYEQSENVIVIDVYRDGLYWEMDTDDGWSNFISGDIGQMYYSKGNETERIITVYTIK